MGGPGFPFSPAPPPRPWPRASEPQTLRSRSETLRVNRGQSGWRGDLPKAPPKPGRWRCPAGPPSLRPGTGLEQDEGWAAPGLRPLSRGPGTRRPGKGRGPQLSFPRVPLARRLRPRRWGLCRVYTGSSRCRDPSRVCPTQAVPDPAHADRAARGRPFATSCLSFTHSEYLGRRASRPPTPGPGLRNLGQ